MEKLDKLQNLLVCMLNEENFTSFYLHTSK